MSSVIKYSILLSAVIGFSLLSGCGSKQKRILVFSKTAGFRHESIREGKLSLIKLGKENDILVDTTEDAGYFNKDSLQNYSAIVFLSTTGDILNYEQQIEMERYIQAGGGFVGIHAATDTEYGWPWYAKMVGGNFEGHPHVQKATIRVINKDHPATADLPDEWIRTDEWYNFKNQNPNVKVLAKIDEKTYEGGKHGDNHPMVWYHEYDGGRAFYTEFGHTKESYSEELFLKHVLGGITYAIGKNKLNYANAKSERQPEANRFSKQAIIEGLNEPMALAIAPDGNVFFCERKGKVFLYEPRKGTTRTVAKLEVDDFAGNGIMGMTLDPGYMSNKWVYLFYINTKNMYVLSRFKMGDNLDLSSEQLIFSYLLDHEPGAHNGGSIAFDSKGNLVISTGDNTPPWQANGYPPYDQREGRELYDAQRTAANTNDYRGKILRIKPNPHGPGYSLPDGNLFSKDGTQGKPEIYAMGCRNPWRMSVDTKTDIVYWGEVGPDAGKDSLIGPRGYDEINQAKHPGNFGWPYFVADNKPYRMVDLVNPIPGNFADVNHPMNTSKNNTGARTLLPPVKAFIYYPYADSPEFPEVGKGGRTACAGPVYHFNDHKGSTVRFPKYFDGKLFIFEWMRDWIRAVTIDKNNDFVKMEPTLENLRFDHPTHMAFAPDGSLYVLEYGLIWYAQNENARLSRIIYSEGNRPPVPMLTASDSIGNVPLKVKFSAKKSSDADHDPITYEWSFTGRQQDAQGVETEFVYTIPGIYRAILTVKDSKGAASSQSIKIIVGNTYPKVDIELIGGNKSFYWPDKSIEYKINVSDKEDQSISPASIKTLLVYMPVGSDIYPMITTGHTNAPAEKSITDHPLIAASDCKACHAYSKKSVGPSFEEVANKYVNDPKATDYLAQKIIKGGAGVWGDHAMSAHPQLSLQTAGEMVAYILSIAKKDEGKYTKELPSQGILDVAEFRNKSGWFYITSSYTDKGAGGLGSLTTYSTVELKNCRLQSTDADSAYKTVTITSKAEGFKNYYQGSISHGSYIMYKKIDLSNIGSAAIRINAKDANGAVLMRIDSPTGEIIGSFPVKAAGAWEKWSVISSAIRNTSGIHDVFLIFEDQAPDKMYQMNLNWIQFSKANE